MRDYEQRNSAIFSRNYEASDGPGHRVEASGAQLDPFESELRRKVAVE